MGAVKSIPVIGEAVTGLDMAGKVIAAGVTAPFSLETAEMFMDAAVESGDDYVRRSPVGASVKALALTIEGHDASECRSAFSTVGESLAELPESLPVVGHAVGVGYYIAGDKERGDHCMKAASRSTAVAAVTIATAGAGAAVVAPLAVATGLTMDVVTTTVDSLVHDEPRASGHVASLLHAVESGDPVAYLDAASGFAFECGMAYLTAKCADKLAQKKGCARVYRVMENSEADIAVETQSLPRAYGAGRAATGETWISETVEHSKTYLPKMQAAQPDIQFGAAEFKVGKSCYVKMKTEGTIPQAGSSARNQAGRYNVFNTERLTNHPQGKVNVGIKNPNLASFNKNIVSVKKIDPSSWRYQNGMTKAISRYGADVTIAGTSGFVEGVEAERRIKIK